MEVKRLVCDFCYAPDPQHRIETLTFEVEDPVPVTERMISQGDFLACDDCHALLVAEDEDGLILRARTAFFQRHGVWHSDAEKILRSFYEQFRANRLRVKP